MIRNFLLVLAISLFSPVVLYAQSTPAPLTGKVVDAEDQTALIAATIVVSDCQKSFAITDENGAFTIALHQCPLTDTSKLIVSAVGYESVKVKVSLSSSSAPLTIALPRFIKTLEKVIVTAKTPISDAFAVTKLERLDIYFNPIAAGDPLRAIVSEPSSTTTDESANPSFRGSSPDRTVVQFNGTPIYQPVRNSQINGLGNFSLFNTEIIGSQYIYPSNPPLIYGNSSAGLVELETIKELDENSYQISQGLANTGIFLSQKLRKKSFIQGYSNYQYSGGFLALNKESFPNLDKFGSIDIGLNIHVPISKDVSLNYYGYFIDESYTSRFNIFNHYNTSIAAKTRNFNIFNIRAFTGKGLWTFNFNNNWSNTKFSFGNIKTKNLNNSFFASANYKHLTLKNQVLQVGIAYDLNNNKFNDQLPKFFYATLPDHPTFLLDTITTLSLIQPYIYYRWDLHPKHIVSAGARLNTADYFKTKQFNYQASYTFKPAKYHTLLYSMGKYFSYSSPAFFTKNINELNSYQFALDYTFEKRDLILKLAAYSKVESGLNLSNPLLPFNQNKIWGLEAFAENTFNRFWRISLAYTYLNSRVSIQNKNYRAGNDMPFFVKAAVGFLHPKIANLFLTYIGRPGLYYTPILGGIPDMLPNVFAPQFGEEFNGAQVSHYNNISLSANRFFNLKIFNLIGYLSVNNLLNFKNIQNIGYNNDFSKETPDYFSLRTLYFGAVFQWQ